MDSLPQETLKIELRISIFKQQKGNKITKI